MPSTPHTGDDTLTPNGPGPGAPELTVALDATPLLGHPTGVGAFCAGALGALAARSEIGVSAFAVSWRRRQALEGLVPSGVRTGQRAMPARPLHWAWRRGAHPALERFVGRVDVVHGTNFVVPPTRRASRVVTVHDLTTVRFPELCDAPTLAYPALIRRALAEGAWIHTPSAFVAQEVIETFGADPARVRAVHSGVPPLPDVRGEAQVMPQRWLPAGTTRYVMAIGTAEPRKDLPGLVKAFGLLASDRTDLALVLAGPEGWGSDELSAAILDSPVSDKVVRTGWLEDHQLSALLRSAAVLAFPSVYEGFGFPPLQAMSEGVPVVASATGALPEVLGDGAVLVAAGDPGALAEALGVVLDDEAHRASLVARGSARAKQFTWAQCAAGLIDVYRDAAAAR